MIDIIIIYVYYVERSLLVDLKLTDLKNDLGLLETTKSCLEQEIAL